MYVVQIQAWTYGLMALREPYNIKVQQMASHIKVFHESTRKRNNSRAAVREIDFNYEFGHWFWPIATGLRFHAYLVPRGADEVIDGAIDRFNCL